MARPSVAVDGGRIRSMRESLYYGRPEFAELVGISQNRLYSIEKRDQSTAPGTLRRIALALKVKPEELLADEEAGATPRAS